MSSSFASSRAAFRVIDANNNRAMEGLRTIEEGARLIENGPALTYRLKQLRHDLQSAMERLDRDHLLAARDVAGDVGTEISTPQEQQRLSLSSIVAAASQRVQQSMRVLEEFGKLVSPDFAVDIERLRYRSYEVLGEAEAIFRRTPLAWLQEARLYVLIDCRLTLDRFCDRVVELTQAGVDIVQLRDKDAPLSKLVEYARAVLEQIDPQKTHLVINDRADLAAALGTAVHLGQEDLPLALARRTFGTRMPVGISTHDIEQARTAAHAGADYIGCGPTFPSSTKSFSVFPGLAFLRQVRQELSLPAFAIGGITLERLDEILETGFQRVAVGHAIWQSEEPGKVAAQFAERLRVSDDSRVTPSR